MSLDLEKINEELRDKSPIEIIKWSIETNLKLIATTKFGPHSAALLHLLTQQKPDATILWADHGYNTKPTYLFAEKLIEKLNLNMKIYTPDMTSSRRDAIMGGVPELDDELHSEFTRQVKLEPFNKAFDEIQPEIWLTGIRKDQTDFRKTLEIVTLSQRGVYKVAPIFNWTEIDLENYLYENDLPMERDYFDPTKILSHRECGLHYTI
ncbi:MAG: phosphoadenosine phosphosulfate reductase family protein [Gammaproteobacteria bacterium]